MECHLPAEIPLMQIPALLWRLNLKISLSTVILVKWRGSNFRKNSNVKRGRMEVILKELLPNVWLILLQEIILYLCQKSLTSQVYHHLLFIAGCPNLLADD